MAPNPVDSDIARPWSPQLRALAIVVAGLYAASAGFHVLCGAINPDEGFYAIASRAVSEGEMPYLDFGYTQMPLLPYINGPILRLIGFGLFEQRVVNGFWALLAVALASAWLMRRRQHWAAVTLIAVCALSPQWMYFIHLGKTYGLTTLLTTMAAWVFLETPPSTKKTVLLSALAVLGVACRLPSMPFFGLLCLAAIGEAKGARGRTTIIATAATVGFALVAWLPFWLMAPDNLWFWTIDFHRVSVPEKHWHLSWEEITTLAPVWWLIVLCTGSMAVVTRRGLSAREWVVAGAAGVALAINLLPAGVYEEYGTPFLLPLAMVVLRPGMAFFRAARPRTRVLLVTGCIVAQLVIVPLVNWRSMPPSRHGTLSQWLPPNTPAFDPTLPLQLARARKVVTQLLPIDRPFIGPALILAAETGRAVPRKLRMGPFSMTTEFPPAVADHRHLLTYPELLRYFSNPDVPMLGFFDRGLLNYAWSMPSFRNPPPEERKKWGEIFRREFREVHHGGGFWLLSRTRALPPTSPRGPR